MNLQDQAILLTQQKFQESSYIVTFFTQSHGIIKGFIRANKKNKSDLLSGNIVNISWNARLGEHLGRVSIEPIRNVFTIIGQDKSKLSLLNSALAMCLLFLHENDPQVSVYNAFISLIDSLDDESKRVKNYLLLELELLKKSGYGMDLSRCIATNSSENLKYISPKSGAAVSADAGEPYKDKMFKLPRFFLDCTEDSSNEDLEEAYKILTYFIEKFFLIPNNKNLPQARSNVLFSQFVL